VAVPRVIRYGKVFRECQAMLGSLPWLSRLMHGQLCLRFGGPCSRVGHGPRGASFIIASGHASNPKVKGVRVFREFLAFFRAHFGTAWFMYAESCSALAKLAAAAMEAGHAPRLSLFGARFAQI
jgi:hypothetical protein